MRTPLEKKLPSAWLAKQLYNSKKQSHVGDRKPSAQSEHLKGMELFNVAVAATWPAWRVVRHVDARQSSSLAAIHR